MTEKSMEEWKNLKSLVLLLPLWLMAGEVLDAWNSCYALNLGRAVGGWIGWMIALSIVYSVCFILRKVWRPLFPLANLAAFSVVLIRIVMKLDMWKKLLSGGGVVPERDSSDVAGIVFFLFVWLALALFWAELPLLIQLLPFCAAFFIPVLMDGAEIHLLIGFFGGLLLFVITGRYKEAARCRAMAAGGVSLLLIGVLIVLFFSQNTYQKLVDWINEQTETAAEGQPELKVTRTEAVLGRFDEDGKVEYHDLVLYYLTMRGYMPERIPFYLKNFEGIRYKDGRWLGEKSSDESGIPGNFSHMNSRSVEIQRVGGAEDLAVYGEGEAVRTDETGQIQRSIPVGDVYKIAYVPQEERYQALLNEQIQNAPASGDARRVDRTIKKICRKLLGRRSGRTYRELVDAVRELFETKYRYSLFPGTTPAGEDELMWFLKKNKTGYCVHFASAAVMFFRSFGIPARYAQGYCVSAPLIRRDRKISVTDDMSHAWAEIQIDGQWVPVDITPGGAAFAGMEERRSGQEEALSDARENERNEEEADGESKWEKDESREGLNVGTALQWVLGTALALALMAAAVFCVTRAVSAAAAIVRFRRNCRKGDWYGAFWMLQPEFLAFLEKRGVKWDEMSVRETKLQLFNSFSTARFFGGESEFREFEGEVSWYVERIFSLRYGDKRPGAEEFGRAVSFLRRITGDALARKSFFRRLRFRMCKFSQMLRNGGCYEDKRRDF